VIFYGKKYPKTKEAYLNLTSVIRSIDANLSHSGFQLIVEVVNQIALNPVPLPRLIGMRCFVGLFVSFFMRSLDCWIFLEGAASSELVTTAWQFVRLILSQKDLVSGPFEVLVELVVPALFLGSFFFTFVRSS